MILTPDEVIEKLKDIGIEISRPTLSRYEKQKLIPKPERGSLGRAGGRWTDYPENTIEEAYAAWKLMHGDYGDESIRELFGGKMPILNPATVSIIREIYYMRIQEIPRIDKARERARKEDGSVDNALFSEILLGEIPNKAIREKIGDHNWFFLKGLESLWDVEIKRAKEKMSGN